MKPNPPASPSDDKMVTAAVNRVDTKAAGVVALAVMCSRVLGLIREQVFAALFGGGRVMDAFTIAFRVPNFLRDMFAEGALSTAFVTTFSRTIATDGEAAAWRLANKVATLTAVVLSFLCLVGIAVAPYIIAFTAPGFDPDKAALTVWLARVMYPFILMVSLAALVMGMLNARHVFGVPAMASSFFNLGSIVGGVTIGWWIDPHFGERAATGLALGTLIGGTMQLAVQMPALFKLGFRLRPDFRWRDAGVDAILRLMGPAVIAASSVQVNVLVNSIYASNLPDGSVFSLQVAFRLMQLPLGMFGVTLGTVSLPVLARLVASGNVPQFRSELARSLRLVFLLTIPSTIGLMVLAEPIVSLLYQHGKFYAQDTAEAAGALRFYAVGLCAYAALKILVNAFYAIDKRRTPMLVSLAAIGLNALFGWFFTFELGWAQRGLAFSTGCVATINFLVLYALMRRRVDSLETGVMLRTLTRVGLAGAVLGLICWAGRYWLLSDWAHQALVPKAIYLLTTIGVAGAGFFVTAMLLKVGELEALTALVKRKLHRH
ncbi:MAG TPA: murein biosynthesis integral membrane protein MurJ [Steroidobacteraceae bacterium]|jgi:putative peptidoglycan lipid II flippase